jgi:hypothetical protein
MQPASSSVVHLATGRIFAMAIAFNDMPTSQNLAGRGYHVVYREHEVNHCPGCGRTHWLVGRVSAECAFCATALPLAEASMQSHHAPAVIQHKNRSEQPAWAA